MNKLTASVSVSDSESDFATELNITTVSPYPFELVTESENLLFGQKALKKKITTSSFTEMLKG